MSNICVLLGAGADAPFDIGTGGDFARNVLGVHNSKEEIVNRMNIAIKEHYSRIVPKNDNWYPPYQFRHWKEDHLIKASLRKQHLEEGITITDDAFTLEYNEIKKDLSHKTYLINRYPSYMGLIDNKFSTIIAPAILGQVKFWQVISCYCRAYLTIVHQILGREDYSNFLNPTKALIEEIRNESKLRGTQESYYSVIKKSKTKTNPTHEITVITTNYTLYCEEIAGLSKESIAYVHGRIGLFESPRDLCVYDLDYEKIDDEIVFPYLFIQSGVKPIIERRQINEYAKMIKFMDQADKIIILGYSLNYDDNHINSIIRSAVLDGKEVVYLSFDDGTMRHLLREDVLKKLRLNSDVANLKWKEILKDDAYYVLEKYLV